MSQTQQAPFVRTSQPNWARGKAGGFSTTTVPFELPEVGASVSFAVDDAGWMQVGQHAFIGNGNDDGTIVGGFFKITAISGLLVTATRKPLTGSATTGDVVPVGSAVRIGGQPAEDDVLPLSAPLARYPGATTVRDALNGPEDYGTLASRTAVQRARGTTAQHAGFTGQQAETTVDTDKRTVVVHDNAKAGGFPLQWEMALDVKQFGAKGDGVTDDTAAIRAALDAVPPGGTLRFSNCADCYLVDAPTQAEHLFTLNRPVTLVADAGVVIKLKGSSNLSHHSYGCMLVLSSYNITLDGLTIDCNYTNNPIISPNLVAPGGIVLVNAVNDRHVNYVVRNCRVVDSGFVSIGVGSIGPSDASHIMDGVIIENNRCELGYQDQIPVSFAKNVLVKGNTCVNPGQYALHAYTNVTNISFVGGTVTHDVAAIAGIPTIYGLGVGHNAFVGTVSNVTVSGVTINFAASSNCNRLGIVVQGQASNVTVSGCSVYGGTIGILAGWGAVGCSITGNTMFGQWNNNACLRGLSRCTFSGNTLTSANQVGGAASDSLGCALYVLSDVALPADGNIITGNNLFKGSLANKPVNGIFLDTGATYRPTNTVIQHNNLDQASTGAVIANMDGYNKTFCRHNRGYATEAGDYQALSGSPVVIPHGLALTPDVITIVPQNGGKTDIHATVDATNITVTFTGGGTEAFFWSARTW